MTANTAHIIAIGDEILYGQTLDTNSHFIARQLAKFNIDLISITVIPDVAEVILYAIQQSQAAIIITTGGLGPTRDDKTKDVMATLTGNELVMNQEALRWTQAYYKKVVKRPMNALNRDQALAPKNSTLLRNLVGTAPGIWTEWQDKIIINLPGVPYEMKYLMTQEVLPRLINKLNASFIVHRFVHVLNIPESELATMLAPLENHLPAHIKLAYLPSSNLVKLRLTTTGKDKRALEEELNRYAKEIMALIPANIVDDCEMGIQEKIAELLLNKNLMLATAESFTSGKIATQITATPGSSAYFKGSIVAYSPKIKIKLLGVSSELIQSKGVVNEEVAKQMALGVLKATGADIALSSTGVAGPSADEFGIEPGTAFMGIATSTKSKVYKYEYPHLDRYEFTEKLTQLAIQQLYSFLKDL